MKILIALILGCTLTFSAMAEMIVLNSETIVGEYDFIPNPKVSLDPHSDFFGHILTVTYKDRTGKVKSTTIKNVNAVYTNYDTLAVYLAQAQNKMIFSVSGDDKCYARTVIVNSITGYMNYQTYVVSCPK